jgi:hypothetical protein
MRRPTDMRAEGPAVHPAKGAALVIGSPPIFPFSTTFRPSGQRFPFTMLGSAHRDGRRTLARWAGKAQAVKNDEVVSAF